ncbi:hypothetical protein BGZ46_005524 [Entomortierella lignicola]|nr:hypothetical protein BGZ46_005524 [Entomortierella lignicola]
MTRLISPYSPFDIIEVLQTVISMLDPKSQVAASLVSRHCPRQLYGHARFVHSLEWRSAPTYFEPLYPHLDQIYYDFDDNNNKSADIMLKSLSDTVTKISTAEETVKEQLPLRCLSKIVGRCTNLQKLSLRAERDGIHVDTIQAIQSLCFLQSLELYANRTVADQEATATTKTTSKMRLLNVQEIVKDLPQLKELVIRGSAFCLQSPPPQPDSPHELLDIKTEDVDQDESQAQVQAQAHNNALAHTESESCAATHNNNAVFLTNDNSETYPNKGIITFPIQHLSIDTAMTENELILLLQQTPFLECLELPGGLSWEWSDKFIQSFAQSCPHLQEFHINSSSNILTSDERLSALIRGLPPLHSFSARACKVGDLTLIALEEKCPELKRLDISLSKGHLLSKAKLYGYLRHAKNLEHLEAEAVWISVQDLLVVSEEQQDQGGDQMVNEEEGGAGIHQQEVQALPVASDTLNITAGAAPLCSGWSNRKTLSHLSIGFSSPDRSTRQCSAIYDLISTLTRLEHLQLSYTCLDLSSSAGFHQLSNLRDLRTFSIETCGYSALTQEDLLWMVTAWPRLERIYVNMPGTSKERQFRAWLKEANREDVALGMSDNSTRDFLIACAQTAKSPADLLRSLESMDIPTNSKTQTFVQELFQRTPRTQSRKSGSKSSTTVDAAKKKRQEEAAALKLLEMNDSFGLVIDEEDTRKSEKKKSKKSSKDKDKDKDRGKEKDTDSTEKKREKKIRRKDDGGDAWESDEEEKEYKRRKLEERERESQPPKTEEELEEERLEREREQDVKEAEEFAKRLRDKDANKTKKLVEDRSSKSDNRRNLADNQEARKAALPSIRERARQEYLAKREGLQIEKLRMQIRDEEQLFDEQELTKKEREDLEYKRELLRLAEERMNINDKFDGYQMPEDYITEKGKVDKKKKHDALYRRYEDEPGDKFVSEQDQWEDQQVRASRQHATRKSDVKEGEEMDYDYVFDEENIDFVLDKQAETKQRESEELLEKITELERKEMSIKQVRESLPIYKFRKKLLEAIEEYQVLVIVGETGSGKTTQLPQYLYEAGYAKGGGKIGCTQPRRVAAMSVAARVAEEMGVKLGYEVGYSIRFEDCTSEKTIMKYMTDGMLLREFMSEPDLAGYSCLIIDEAHERTLHTDILLGLVKDIARLRTDLKVLISSATMDAEKFADYFDGAPIFNIPGRPFHVDTLYTPSPEANYLAAAITTVMQIHISQGPGDILVFLTGQDEIDNAAENLNQTCRVLGDKIQELIVCPIYSSLPSDMQGKIFEPTPEGARKVVLATNIAETSITIDGVKFVIDPGFSKMLSYNPKTGMESLVVTPCSRASANQRKGRAGRVGTGMCFRLYTKWAYLNELEENTVPEIQRINLNSVVLTLKSLGINDIIGFDFMDPPPAETLMRALEQLYALGALNDKGQLTKLGRRMAEFPGDPMLAKTLIMAEKYHCTEEIASIVAMLSVQNAVFYRPKDKKLHADKARQNLTKPGGDHLTLLNIWDQWVEANYSIQWCYENFLQHRSMSRARDIRDQMVGLMERTEVAMVSNPNPADTAPIRKAITSGFFYNAAKLTRSGDSYRTVKSSQTVMIHPSSSLYQSKPRWVVYFELVLTSKEFMRVVMEIEGEWLKEVAPHYYKDKDLDDDSKKKMPKGQGMAKIAPPP